MNKKLTILLVTSSILIGGVALNNITNQNVVYADSTTEENNAITYTEIHNQQDLDNYIEKAGTELGGLVFKNKEKIVFPKNVYTIKDTEIVFWQIMGGYEGVIDFNDSVINIGNDVFRINSSGDHKGKVIKNLTVNGSVGINVEEYLSSGKIENPNYEESKKHYNGSFYWGLINSDNIHFENMNFNNALSLRGHIFDVMGSENVSFNNITIAGSPISKDWTQDQLKRLWDKYRHALYAEGIQIDVATSSAAGGVNITPNKDLNYKAYWNTTYDDSYSKNITIENSKFIEYNGKTSLSNITGQEQIVSTYAPRLGSHSDSKLTTDTYENILVKNSEMGTTVVVEGVKHNELAPIGFLTANSHNWVGKESPEKEESIRVDYGRLNQSIRVENVRFNDSLKNIRKIWNQSGVTSEYSAWAIWWNTESTLNEETNNLNWKKSKEEEIPEENNNNNNNNNNNETTSNDNESKEEIKNNENTSSNTSDITDKKQNNKKEEVSSLNKENDTSTNKPQSKEKNKQSTENKSQKELPKTGDFTTATMSLVGLGLLASIALAKTRKEEIE